jgi:hypothetical protein
MKNKLIVPLLSAALLIGSAASVAVIAGAASADASTVATNTTTATSQSARPQRTPPAAMGKVTAVSGSTITITNAKTNTTYTVDASNATVTKGKSTSEAVSAIAVGDTIAVTGTVSGTNVTATAIHDGIGGQGGRGGHGGFGGMGGGVMGTVSAVNGSSLTVTTKSGGTYTVDASSATVKESGATSTVTNIKVGDTVMIQGSVTTASMTAKNIEDGVRTAPASHTTSVPQS